MQILALECDFTPGDTGTLREMLRAEAAVVWQLQRQEVIRAIWFTRADQRAVLLLECAGEDEARAHLATLPLVRAGRLRFAVHALRAYDGFARLLTPDAP